MGTRFRTMLAPIGVPTGDGRRFGAEAITLAETPFPFEWARSREEGHGGAVAIGVVQEAALLTVGQAIEQGYLSAERADGMDLSATAVWGRGELFDDVDREQMPRLAEDVAEVLHLVGNGTLGPSVDLDTFEGVPVLPGSDVPVTFEDMERIFEKTGADPKLELLITAARVRAATLVSLPAFAETSRPLELLIEQAEGEPAVALIASMAATTEVLPDISAFAAPPLDRPTPITWDWEAGRVFGHIATWKTCHVGYQGVCVTPPRDGQDGAYAAFNRFPVETPDGPVWAGRITVGGRHAGLALNASSAMNVYDGKTVAAYVRAYEDEHGIVVAGVIQDGLTPLECAVLNRRKVSGDWRETPSGMSLVDVLALSPGPRQHSEPGFPVETFSRAGRQVSLVASLSPDPGQDVVAVFSDAEIEQAVKRVTRRRELAATLSTAVETFEETTRAAARRALATALTAGEG